MGISLENVSYTYQSGTPFERRALFDMTVTIKDGSYTAFIGHTGSGKSTIMQLLNGLYLPTSGPVSYTHLDVYKRQALLCKRGFESSQVWASRAC